MWISVCRSAASVSEMMIMILLSSLLSFTHLSTQDTSAQSISAVQGSTVYLTCRSSEQLKQRWAFRRSPDSRKEFISTLFRNHTVKKERADLHGRFTHTAQHLSIAELQTQDSGLYLCNNRETAVLTVTAAAADSESSTPGLQQHLLVLVLLVLCVLAMVCVCLLSVLISRNTRSKAKETCRKQTEGLELQTVSDEGRWTADALEETVGQEEVQYACLGVQHWSDTHRPQISKQQVIYSTLLTGTHTP
ncbi:uncharacterized protein isoform X4 [Danio rerio]|uniref:Uncharacterized protein isoform X4 n=3 Tax=Danio rerio TaxID=7955 RepID=A0AC58I1I5_DANRE